MKKLRVTTLKFPEVELKIRDAHKLRGFFGNLFAEHSPLLHNHFGDGNLRYQYPLVQYKVLHKTPTLVGIDEGAKLLTQLFTKIKELSIDGITYQIETKDLEQRQVEVGYASDLQTYQFVNLWMALNKENYNRYKQATPKERNDLLKRILVGNVLSQFRDLGVQLNPEERLLCTVKSEEKRTRFKNQEMLAFKGEFVINAHLPEGLGIGKSVSRGFGTVIKL